MKPQLFLLSLILSLPACSLAAFSQTPPDPRQAIESVIRQQQDAWNRADLEAFMSGYWNSPDLTFFSGGHESKGWQAALDRYKKSYQGAGHEMGKLEFANLRIEMLGPESAFVRGEFPPHHVRRQNPARPVHVGFPEISRRMENRARPLSGRMTKLQKLEVRMQK